METDQEEWRAIPHWEGFYEASSSGRIRSLDRVIMRPHVSGRLVPLKRRGQLMKQIPWPGSRYLTVTLKNAGQAKTAEVQTIVCRTFHGPRPPKAHAAHTDGDPSNNRPSNLRWATASENMQDAIGHGTAPRADRHGMAKLTLDQVRAIKRDAVSTNMDLAKIYPVSHTAISRIRSGHRWSDVT